MKLGLVLLLALPIPALQSQVEQRLQNVAGIPPAEMRKFLAELQRAAQTNDTASIGQMMKYPLRVRAGKKQIRLAGPTDFAKNAPDLLTDKVRQAIEHQKFDDLFVNYRGVMIGQGEMWIAVVCRDKACKDSRLRIVGLNP